MSRVMGSKSKATPYLASWEAGSQAQDITAATADASPVEFPNQNLDNSVGIRLVIGGSEAPQEEANYSEWDLMLVDYSAAMADGGDPTVIECISFRSTAVSRRTDADDNGGIYFHQLIELQNVAEFHALYLRGQSSRDHTRRWVLSLRGTDQQSGNLYLLDYYAIPGGQTF